MNGSKTNPLPPNRASRTLLGFGNLLAPLIVCSCVTNFVSADTSRYEVTGKVDPATGYKIEYTVSSRFQQEDMLKRIKGTDKQYFEFVRFRPASDPAEESGGKSMEDGKSTSHAKSVKPLSLSFSEATLTSGYSKGTTIDKLGYLTPDNAHNQYGKAVYQQRITISGCPTTWSAFDTKSELMAGSTQRFYLLLIKLPGKPRVYEFVGIADGKQEEEDAQAELTAIRDSIRITNTHIK